MAAPRTRWHVALGVVGGTPLLISSQPVAWDRFLNSGMDVWTVTVLATTGTVLGAVAGALDGAFARSEVPTNAVLVTVFDAVLLLPHWWVSFLALALLQWGDEAPPPETVAVPVLGWLLGPLVVHIVSGVVCRGLERRSARAGR